MAANCCNEFLENMDQIILVPRQAYKLDFKWQYVKHFTVVDKALLQVEWELTDFTVSYSYQKWYFKNRWILNDNIENILQW